MQQRDWLRISGVFFSLLLFCFEGETAPPDPQLRLDSVCSGKRVIVVNKNDYLGKKYFFHWTGPYNFSSGEMEPVIRKEGNYRVWVEDSLGFSTVPIDTFITFYRHIPFLNIVNTNLSWCEGKAVPPIQITGYAPPDTVITYQNEALTVVYRKDVISLIYIDIPVGTFFYYLVRRDTDLCESDSAVKVTMVKNPRPKIEITATDSFSCTKTQIVLDASKSDYGSNYTSAWTGPGIVSYQSPLKPVVNQPGTYKLTILNNTTTCSRTDSFKVKPFVPPVPGVPRSNVRVCDTGLFNLFYLLDGYSPGGHWIDDNHTGRLVKGNFFNASGATEGGYSFSYAIDSINPVCTGGSVQCQFQLVRYKNPGVPLPASVCNAGNEFNLFNALSGYTEGGIWKNATHPSWVSGNTFMLQGVPEGEYTFTYAFQPPSQCASDSVQVPVRVFSMKNTGIPVPQHVCPTAPFNLFDALTEADRGGVWEEEQSTGRLTDSVFYPVGLKGGTYFFHYGFPGNPCPVQTARVAITTDTVKPILLCYPRRNLSLGKFDDEVLEAPAGIDSLFIISVSDNCGKYTLSNNITNDSTLAGARIPRSVQSVVWTARDSAQNIAVCETKIKFITIPNIFTPNGDGHNDTWDFSLDEEAPEGVVIIFDRWGHKVWESARGYPVKWDGANVPEATYRYVIMNGKEMIANGYVNLVR